MVRRKKVAGGIGIALILIIAVVAIVWLAMDEEVDYGAKCAEARVIITAAEFSPSDFAKVTLKGIGNTAEEIGGVKLTFSDANGNILEEFVAGSLPNFETKIREVHYFDFIPIKVEASVYFIKSNDEKYICSESKSKIMRGVNECTAYGYTCINEPACTGEVKDFEGCDTGEVCCDE